MDQYDHTESQIDWLSKTSEDRKNVKVWTSMITENHRYVVKDGKRNVKGESVDRCDHTESA